MDEMEYSEEDGLSDSEPKTILPSIRNLPQRYKIIEQEGKKSLICLETPNIRVQIEPGFSVSSSAARKSAPCTIYLDGVAQAEPFLDLEKQIYNFDHHEGCVRAFTLATCEQVLVMILKGLDLRGRDWRVWANEPDLDTMLAIWLIFNHVRIQQKEFGGLDRLCALVRLEGIIDTHGLEMASLTGFSPKFLAKIQKLIGYLRAEEIDLKSRGIWRESDPLEYAELILHKVDRIIYKSSELGEVKDVKELARVEFGENRIAVVVETQLGIYELETYLDRLYGERLGIVILRKEKGAYTLRSMDPFMPRDLNAVYRILNFVDPAVRGRSEGNKWGGSSDIGGSPRGDGGTQLTPLEIAHACRDAFTKPGVGAEVIRFVYTLVLTGAIIGISNVFASYLFSASWLGLAAPRPFLQAQVLFFVAVILLTFLCLIIFAHKRPWQFGWCAPIGRSWLMGLPFIFLTMIGLGVYFPSQWIKLAENPETTHFFIAAIPLASELLFRSLIHGLLLGAHHFQSYGDRWSISFPLVATALLYSVCTAVVLLYPTFFQNGLHAQASAACLALAFVLGLVSGFVREKSQSIFPGILFHALGVAALLSYYSGGWISKIGTFIR